MISSARKTLEQRKGRQAQVTTDLANCREKIDKLVVGARWCEEAQTIIQTVAQATQQELEYHVGELVTLAMAAVFEDPYQLEVEFVQRRGRTETDLWFVRNGSKVDPLSSSGGGAVDVACFALRVALWSLAPKRTRPTLVLDEPLKFLSEGYQEKASGMIKEIATKLGVQIIMVTHIEQLKTAADSICAVSKLKNGTSSATTQQQRLA